MDSGSATHTDPTARTNGPCPIAVYLYTSRRFPPILIGGRQPEDSAPDERDLCEVRIIDNDYNTYQQVMEISILALNVSEQDAYAIAWEVDHKGSCVVAHGPREDAEHIAGVIRTIGIEVQVNPVEMTTM